MGTRICIVGGGSAYMPGIAFAFAHLGERFAGATLVLQDLDGEALELQRRLSGGSSGRGAPGTSAWRRSGIGCGRWRVPTWS